MLLLRRMEFFMSKTCSRCKVKVLDHTEYCPLCGGVLKKDTKVDKRRPMGYPDVYGLTRKRNLALRILLAICVVAGFLLLATNYMIGGRWWSVIPCIAILYGYVVFSLYFNPTNGYMKRIIWTFVLTLAFMIALDICTGFYRWSINYCLPLALLLYNIAGIVLMIVNHRRWESYMIFLMTAIFVGFVPLGLIHFKVVTEPILSQSVFISSVCIFLGTLIIGGGRARTELGRRFHV